MQLTWTQSGQTDPHAVTVLFLWPSYIQNVTRSEQKLHHSACSCPRRLHVWGRWKFTKHSLTLQEKALHFFFWISNCMLLLWTKKKNHHRDSRREERCFTCDIMLDQARSAQGKSRGQSRIGPALRWSRLIEHDITHGTAFFSPRISRMVLFFCPG